MNLALCCGAGFLLVLGQGPRALAQPSSADSSLVATAQQSLSQYYTRALGDAAHLYNGPEYINYVRRDTQGHRFFGSDAAQPATITYDGHAYPNVPLWYDLVRGQLVLTAPGGALTLLLLNERVSSFTVGGHSFIRLVGDSSGHAPVRTGYYDLLLDGPVQLLAARHKTLRIRALAEGVESTITASTDYLVRKDHRYYPVSNAASVLRLFPEQRAALQQYRKSNRLLFGTEQREQALLALLRYQATLPGPPSR